MINKFIERNDSGALLCILAESVGPRGLLVDEADMRRHTQDWRGNFPGRALAVALPADTAQVSAVVRACAAHGVAIVPQGGNTGLVGGSVPDGSGRELVLCLSRMARVRHVDPLGNTLAVEAGCTLQAVQEAAQQHGRLFPLSLGSQGTATIGGNLATNAGGEQVLRYGNARELALGLEVVLADGRVLDLLSPLRKDNTGYDLKQLFIGAEGTLGVITAATLKLFPQPTAQCTAWAALADPASAVALLARLREALGERITAFELMGREALAQVLKHFPGQRPLKCDAPWFVLVECSDSGDASALLACCEAAFAAVLEEGRVLDVTIAASVAQAQALWALRDHVPEAQRLDGPSMKHDISLPIAQLAPFIERAEPVLQAIVPGIRVICFGHVGDGNLHYNQSAPPGMAVADFRAREDAVHDAVHSLVAELGGSISAEHGIGRLKQRAFLQHKNPLAIELMRRVKRALDPQNLFNPGRLLPVEGTPA